jgi:hypothetical protein
MFIDENVMRSLLVSMGLVVAIATVLRYGLIFVIDTYYDALERVRVREQTLPSADGDTQTDVVGFHTLADMRSVDEESRAPRR